ncbi:hypothetical protein KM043_009385 [Ampulex compressa]|nr:hypothetical protein KM043_009385 [Ampulex compressa]
MQAIASRQGELCNDGHFPADRKTKTTSKGAACAKHPILERVTISRKLSYAHKYQRLAAADDGTASRITKSRIDPKEEEEEEEDFDLHRGKKPRLESALLASRWFLDVTMHPYGLGASRPPL